MTHFFIFNNASRAANYGVGTYIRQLSEGLSICPDTAVTFIDMYANVKEFAVTTDEQGYRHYQIPAAPTGRESDTYCRCQFYLLARHIHADASDRLVFQFNYFHHFSLAALLKAHFPDCRIILTVHYLNWCFELNGNLSRLRTLISEGYEPSDDTEQRIIAGVTDEQRFLHLADEVFVLSRSTRSILTEDYKVNPDKLQLIYNGGGDSLSPRPSEASTFRHILFMGRLDEIKGLKYLISAFEKIAPKHTDARLVIAGDGDFQPYLSQSRSMQGRVSFLGRVQGDEVQQVYRTAYIGVMPSFHEQCSYTAIEMMRHGIPLIGTDSTGLAEMLDATPQLRIHIDEENFEEESFVSQIADRLELLLSDQSAYHKFSQAVCRLFEERYRTSSMTQSIQDALHKSFDRPSYILSTDYLPHIDERMKRLVEQRPDIDTDFFGLSGIAVYLWWRFCSLQEQAGKEEQTATLRTVLEQCMEWMLQAVEGTQLSSEMTATLLNMQEKSFCPAIAKSLSATCDSTQQSATVEIPAEYRIIHNALNICNCKI